MEDVNLIYKTLSYVCKHMYIRLYDKMPPEEFKAMITGLVIKVSKDKVLVEALNMLINLRNAWAHERVFPEFEKIIMSASAIYGWCHVHNSPSDILIMVELVLSLSRKLTQEETKTSENDKDFVEEKESPKTLSPLSQPFEPEKVIQTESLIISVLSDLKVHPYWREEVKNKKVLVVDGAYTGYIFRFGSWNGTVCKVYDMDDAEFRLRNTRTVSVLK